MKELQQFFVPHIFDVTLEGVKPRNDFGTCVVVR
jgi:hypothetical protein